MGMSSRFRQGFVAFCFVISVLAIIFGVFYSYSVRTFFNADTFASRVADGLTEPEIAKIISGQMTDKVIAAHRDLMPFRPLILGSVGSVVKSQPFRAMVRAAVKESHQTVISETGLSISLTLGDSSVLVRNALAEHPHIAEKLPAGALEALESPHTWPNGDQLAKLMRAAHRMRLVTYSLFGLGLIAGAVGLALTRHPLRYLMRWSTALVTLAFLVGVTAQFGGPLFAKLAAGEFAQQLIRGLWPAFVGPLALRMWAICGMGLVMVAGLTSTFDRIDVEAIVAFLRRVIDHRPQNDGLALLRATLLIAVGAVVFFYPLPAIQVFVVGWAAVLFFLGVQEAFSIMSAWMPQTILGVETPQGKRGQFTTGAALVAVLSLAAIGTGVWFFLIQDRAPVPPQVVDACNGHPELCDRRLNEVAFATTHNSMGGADIDSWMFPNQEKGIPSQLAHGVRGLLIDLHYGIPVGDQVKTVLEDDGNDRATYVKAVGEEGFDAAMRIRDRIVGDPTGPQDVYLAHGFCELGNMRFTDMLKHMRKFLVMNPGEILVIIIQDEGVTPLDVAACFEKTGLLPFIYQGAVTPPWPTLREMIDSNQRLLVMAENNSEGVPWYHSFTEVCQETPYGFGDPSKFSNQPNRGGTAGSLLLMNHWIETGATPLPSNAEIVNAYDFLLDRAQACQKERGMIPNLIAVDFFRSGNLIKVVDELNGVGSPQ